MRRWDFIKLLGLIGCTEDMLLAQHGLLGTPNDEDLFLFLGDSNCDGRGATVTTNSANTLFRWNGSSFDQITTQTVSNDGSYGSIWKYFAEEYKSTHGHKVYGVFEGHSGAMFNGIGISGTNDFGSTGTRYAAAVSAANAAKAALGVSRLKAVVVNLGLNDINPSIGGTLANIQSEIDYFFTNIQADFPNTPILFITPGQAATNDDDDSRGYDVRAYLISKVEQNLNCHIFASALAYSYVTSAYNADFIHYEDVMLQNLGKQLSRWFSNIGIPNKWARSVVTAHYSNLTSAHKTLVTEVVTGLYNDGVYFGCEQIGNFKTETINDAWLDWTFLGFFGQAGSLGFTANSHVSTNGTSTILYASYANARYTRTTAGRNNFMAGVKLKSNVTGSGTTAVLLCRGLAAGAAIIRIAQTTTNVIYNANDNTNTNGSESSLASNNMYTVARNSGTRYLYKNKTQNASNADASESVNTKATFIGADVQGITISLYFAGQYEYFYAGPYDTTKHGAFYDRMEYLIANW